ncbi:hypothetical protein FKM82_021758 [Ascaphus truei]
MLNTGGNIHVLAIVFALYQEQQSHTFRSREANIVLPDSVLQCIRMCLYPKRPGARRHAQPKQFHVLYSARTNEAAKRRNLQQIQAINFLE